MKKLIIPIKDIIQLYNEGLSCKKIAVIHNCSESFINKKLKQENITKRIGGSYRRKYNQNFFNSIDTEEKAYWLGFMFADGCVQHKKTGQKLISLAVKDKEVIDKFITSIEGNFETKKYKDVYVVHLTSNQMFRDLVNLGCVPKKSLVLMFPEISNSLINHFIRGYFDGDGCVSISYPKNRNRTNTIYKSIRIHICGTKEFLEVCNSHLNLKSPKKEKRKEGNIWHLSASGSNKVLSFYEFVYKNSTIYLQRKKDKFANYFKERCSTTTISHPDKDEGIV